MILPVKFKSPFNNENMLSYLLGMNEAKRMFALNRIRIGLVFKTTSVSRYPVSTAYMNSLSQKFSNVHDIGCSDGSASLTLMENLSYVKYFGLDLNISVKIIKSGQNYFLVDENENIHMFENKYLRVYLDPLAVQKKFSERFISWVFRCNPGSTSEVTNVDLVNPECKKIKDVTFKNFDLFNDQLKEKSDLIIIFNLLNKFDDADTLKNVKSFLFKNLNENGIALIGENEPYEKATVYKKNRKLNIVKLINGGSSTIF